MIESHYHALFSGHRHEIIIIRDAKSLCEGYTRGYEQSTGQLLVFSHDDIEFVTQDVPARLLGHLAQFDLVGIAGTTRLISGTWVSAGDPYCFALVIYPEADGLFSVRYAGAGPLCVPNVQALDGCFFACRREVVDAVGFDSEIFDDFHLYDVDFTFQAYRKGFQLAVCRDLALIHSSRGKANDRWQHYRERFEAKYRGQLSEGTPGTMQTVGVTVAREKLALLCDPEYLLRAIRWS